MDEWIGRLLGHSGLHTDGGDDDQRPVSGNQITFDEFLSMDFTRELFRWYCLDETSRGSLCSAVVKGFQSKTEASESPRQCPGA